MFRHLVLSTSLALNVALAGVAIWLVGRPALDASARWPQATQRPALVHSQSGQATRPASLLPMSPSVTFDWSQVASTNLSVYATNLRAIECPNEVVVQIIRTVANEDFARRRHAQFEPLHARFWDLIVRGGDAGPNGELGTELSSHELDANRSEQLEAALGPNWSREVEPLRQRGYVQPTLSFLPAETQRRWMELDENFTRQQQDIFRQTSGDPAAQKVQLETLVRERDDLRGQLLSPEQSEEYTVRTGANSGWAQSLAGFEASEAEYRSLNRLRADTPTNQVSAFNAQAQALLGEDRFAVFLRAQDPRFHELLTLARRCQLPVKRVEQIYQLRVAAEQEAARLGAELTLSADDRSALLNALQFEKRLQLLAILGETAGEAYLRHHGDWLAAITQSKSASPKGSR